jgi:ribosome maturation protein Sdo1
MLTYFHRQGAQGILDRASNAQLDSEFGTHKIEEVAKLILEKGQVIQNKVGLLYPYTGLA